MISLSTLQSLHSSEIAFANTPRSRAELPPKAHAQLGEIFGLRLPINTLRTARPTPTQVLVTLMVNDKYQQERIVSALLRFLSKHPRLS